MSQTYLATPRYLETPLEKPLLFLPPTSIHLLRICHLLCTLHASHRNLWKSTNDALHAQPRIPELTFEGWRDTPLVKCSPSPKADPHSPPTTRNLRQAKLTNHAYEKTISALRLSGTHHLPAKSEVEIVP